MRGRDQILFNFVVSIPAADFEIETQRCSSSLSYPHADFQKIVELRRAMKVTLQMHARQPDVQLVEDHAVRQTDRAEQFRLGNFKKANVRAVKNDAGGVHIAPAHAFFDSELLALSHLTHCLIDPMNE